MRGSEPDESSKPTTEPELRLFDSLEVRVLAMSEALKEAREARRAAESKLRSLQEKVRDRDMRIVLLKKKVEQDDLRNAVRTRVEALIRRIDELESGD